MTSPRTDRRRSVTSSGRSPTSTTIRCASGWLAATAAAIACSTIVLPALGGDTISPRWPLPMGVTRSMIRAVGEPAGPSSRSRSCGYSGVSSANSGRCAASAGSAPLTLSTRVSPGYLSRVLPVRGGPLQQVTGAQAVLLDQGGGDVDIIRASLVAGPAEEGPAVADAEDAGHRGDRGGLGRGRWLGALRLGAPAQSWLLCGLQHSGGFLGGCGHQE